MCVNSNCMVTVSGWCLEQMWECICSDIGQGWFRIRVQFELWDLHKLSICFGRDRVVIVQLLVAATVDGWDDCGGGDDHRVNPFFRKFLISAAYHRNLIIKRQIPSLTRRQLFRCDKAFNNEISVYCHVVPILKQFSNNRIPFANCLYAGSDAQGEIIALDDLQQFGYRMANRLKGLDYSHCKVVMQVNLK